MLPLLLRSRYKHSLVPQKTPSCSLPLDSSLECISFIRLPSRLLQTGCLKLQKFILLQFWKLKVHNQGAGKPGSFWRLWGRICSTSLFWLMELSAILGVPLPMTISLLYLLPSSDGILPPRLCPNFPLLVRISVLN